MKGVTRQKKAVNGGERQEQAVKGGGMAVENRPHPPGCQWATTLLPEPSSFQMNGVDNAEARESAYPGSAAGRNGRKRFRTAGHAQGGGGRSGGGSVLVGPGAAEPPFAPIETDVTPAWARSGGDAQPIHGLPSALMALIISDCIQNGPDHRGEERERRRCSANTWTTFSINGPNHLGLHSKWP